MTHSRIHSVQSRQLHLRLTRHFLLSSCYVMAHLCIQRALPVCVWVCVCITWRLEGEGTVSLRVSNTNRELHRKEIIFPSLLIHSGCRRTFFFLLHVRFWREARPQFVCLLRIHLWAINESWIAFFLPFSKSNSMDGFSFSFHVAKLILNNAMRSFRFTCISSLWLLLLPILFCYFIGSIATDINKLVAVQVLSYNIHLSII